MIIVPTNTPGVKSSATPTMASPITVRATGGMRILYTDASSFENVVGGEDGIGQGFAFAQSGWARSIHRDALALASRGRHMLGERALTDTARLAPADNQMVQDWIAASSPRCRLPVADLASAWKWIHCTSRSTTATAYEIGVISSGCQ